MTQYTPNFGPSGAMHAQGSVPDSGSVAGTSRFLREDAIWAIPNAGPPGPPAPSPGPSLDQWACNAAGFIIYELCYKLVKSAIDTNFFSLAVDAIIGFAFDSLAEILIPLEILDSAFLTWLENWVSTVVLANLATFEAHILDQVLWSKFHCFLYNEIRTAGNVSNTILLAAGIALGASGIVPSAITNGVALILQQFGVMSVGPVPLSAFVQNYDCSTCAGTGSDSAPIPLQTLFDLVVTDGTTTQGFIDRLKFVNALVTVSGSEADVEVPVQFDASAIVTGSLSPQRGGTGASSAVVPNGYLLIGDGSTNTFAIAALTAGVGIVLTSAPGGLTIAAPPPGVAALASGAKTGNVAGYNLTNTTMVDIDTGLDITIMTGAHRCLISVAASGQQGAGSSEIFLDVELDGSLIGNAPWGLAAFQSFAPGALGNLSFTYLTDALTAGSHTFKLFGRVNTANGVIGGSTVRSPLRFAVVELYA